jgi:Xaa-Pro aminopeptidase
MSGPKTAPAQARVSDPKIRETAEGFVKRYRVNPNAPAGAAGPRSLGHSMGMEVHDVRDPTATLEPGYIFTIEPQMTMEASELSSCRWRSRTSRS